MSRRLIPIAIALNVSFFVGTAFAQEEHFGKAGVLNISSDLSLSIQSTSFKAPSGETSPDSVTSYSIGPAADFFVIDNLSVGGLVEYAHTSEQSSKLNTFIIEPRVGYHISLVPGSFGLWPRLEFGYSASTISGTGFPDATTKNVVVGAFVPLLIHPVEHFHIGIGPFIDTDLSSKTEGQDGVKSTTLGIRTEIGGWWNLF